MVKTILMGIFLLCINIDAVANTFTEIKEQCNNGDLNACYNTAVYYKTGKGTQQNDVKAAEIYNSLCSTGYMRACNNLGMMYEDGVSVEQDYQNAFLLYTKACDSGIGHACANLAYMYSKGHGVKKDGIETINFYIKACNNNYSKGCYFAGTRYVEGNGVKQNFSKALKLYFKACDDNFVDACYNLGLMHTQGLGVDKDLQIAKQYYKLACDGGNDNGCHNFKIIKGEEHKSLCKNSRECTKLGLNLYNQKNYVEASKYLHLACIKGNGLSCTKLGDMYLEGKGVALDKIKGAKLYIKAVGESTSTYSKAMANFSNVVKETRKDNDILPKVAQMYKLCQNGNMDQCSALGFMSAFGIGVEQDSQLAEKSWIKACNKGDGESCYYLTSITLDLYTGKIIGSKNISYLKKSCNLGYMPGCDALASEYIYGLNRSITQDINYGLSLKQMVCKNNNAGACLELASWFQNGKYVKNNTDKAKYFYKKACDLGSPEGCRYLGYLISSTDYALCTMYLQDACKIGEDVIHCQMQLSDWICKGRK